MNTHRVLADTDFGHHKETSLIYKQHMTSVIDYASPSWASNQSNTHLNTQQITQNKDLLIIKVCILNKTHRASKPTWT